MLMPSLPVCRQNSHRLGFNCSLPPIGGRSRLAIGQGSAQVWMVTALLSPLKQACAV